MSSCAREGPTNRVQHLLYDWIALAGGPGVNDFIGHVEYPCLGEPNNQSRRVSRKDRDSFTDASTG